MVLPLPQRTLVLRGLSRRDRCDRYVARRAAARIVDSYPPVARVTVHDHARTRFGRD